MVRLITIFSLSLLFTLAQAQQEVNNFRIDEGNLSWVMIYSDSTLNFENLLQKVKESGVLSTLEVSENKIIGETNEFDADFKGAGYSQMGSPIYIPRSTFKGFVVIEFKDFRYRVSFKNIIAIQKYDDPLSKQGQKTKLENFAVKNGKNEFANIFKKAASEILTYTFKNKFSFSKGKTSDDW